MNLLEENRRKNEAKNELKDKVVDYLNNNLAYCVDDELEAVLNILGIELSDSGFKWERI